MFSFMLDIGNYEERKVARYENHATGCLVSTAQISDGRLPYETGVAHPAYNDGKIVIVEAYGSRELAEAGHSRWVTIMTAELIPARLTDCANSEISQMLNSIEPEALVFERDKRWRPKHATREA